MNGMVQAALRPLRRAPGWREGQRAVFLSGRPEQGVPSFSWFIGWWNTACAQNYPWTHSSSGVYERTSSVDFRNHLTPRCEEAGLPLRSLSLAGPVAKAEGDGSLPASGGVQVATPRGCMRPPRVSFSQRRSKPTGHVPPLRGNPPQRGVQRGTWRLQVDQWSHG